MKVQLVKGLSYATKKISAVKGVPVVVTAAEGEKLLATGRFAEVTEKTPVEQPPEGKKPASNEGNGADGSNNDGDGPELTASAIDRMTTAELEALAASKGIDLSDCGVNKERATKIKDFLGLVDMSQVFGE